MGGKHGEHQHVNYEEYKDKWVQFLLTKGFTLVCEDCMYRYNIAATRYSKLRKRKSALSGIKLMPYFKELKDRVSKAKVEFYKNYPMLEPYQVCGDDIEDKSDELATAWLDANPQATMMEFYSDKQDHAEAVLRFLMYRFTKYCKKKGLRCLHVDYS